MSQEPSAGVLAAFSVQRPIDRLVGGEGHAWRVGDIVLKPSPGQAEWTWLGEHLTTVREQGFRLALPVPAQDGRWVVGGWCAQTWVAGSHPAVPRWLEVLGVCGRLHAAMRHLPRPSFLDDRTHPYAISDRAAWGEIDPPVGHTFLDRLLALRRPVDLPFQAVHGDLTDNVLFADRIGPAVIDPTIYWRPAGLASAVVVGDAIRWADADPAMLLGAVQHLDAFPQLFVRAVIFRLVTTLMFDRGGLDPYASDVALAEQLSG